MNMPRTVNMADAQHHFPQILAEVCNGAEVVIARGAMPVARLTPIVQPVLARAPEQKNEGNAWQKNLAAIKKLRKKAVIGPPLTIEEIISARDEGRK